MPQGNIQRIMDYTKLIRKNLKNFKKPDWLREPVCVTGFEGTKDPIFQELDDSKSLVLLGSPWNRGHNQEPSWRLPLYEGNRYLNSRDRRNKYDRSLDVLKEIASYGYEHDGKKTIYIYPEMNHTDKDFGFVMKNQVYPLVEFMGTIKSNVAFRAKNVFWQGQVYTKDWEPVV